MQTNVVRLALTAAVVAPLVAVGVGIGAGTAAAARPPWVSVTLSGANQWSVTWDGTPASGCTVYLGALANPGNAAAGSMLAGPPAGRWPVSVVCGAGPNNTSATVFLYSPRSQENDLRTQFSSATQGLFAS